MKLKSWHLISSIFVILALLLSPTLLNFLIGKHIPEITDEVVKGLALGLKIVLLVVALYVLSSLIICLMHRSFRAGSLALIILLVIGLAFKYVDYSKFYLEKKISANKFNEYSVRFNLVENHRFAIDSHFKDIIPPDVRSVSQMASILSASFSKDEDLIRGEINTGSKEIDFAVFLMGFVSQAWAYGNLTKPNESGCVFNNENDRSGLADKIFIDYLSSKIGCCTDYAYFLKTFLDHFKIENKLVLIKGHIFNEVKINGSSYVLDANINTLYTLSWKDIVESDLPFDVVSFPHVGTDKSNPKFRPIIGHFRQKMYWLVNTRYSFFEYQNQIPVDYAKVLGAF